MREKCIQLEYTAPYTPQLNGVVECRIAVLLNRARAFLYAANFTEDYRKKLWAEAVNCAEDVRNSMATSGSTKSANELFYGRKSSFVCHLIEFGRIRYITRRDTKIKGKLSERAIKCIMVGYARNHARDVYRLYNPSTKRISLSRDVTWADWKWEAPRANMDVFIQYNPIEIVPGVDELIVELTNEQNRPAEAKKVYTIYDDEDEDEIVKVETESQEQGELKLSRELRRLHTS